ncbi:MAG TPA: DUF6155 family protein, partial [Hanamia sp.]
KPNLKKELQKLNREQLIEQVMDLYKKYKPVKEYYDFYLNPNEKELFEKYKEIITNEFYPKKGGPKMRFSVAKKAIADFKAFSPSPLLLADLLLSLPELATEFTSDNGDMWEQYYISAANNFDVALKFISSQELFPQFKERIKNCLQQASECGWGYGDDLDDIYYNYFGADE